MGMKIGAASMENNMEVTQEIKNIHLWWNMMEDNVRKMWKIYIYDWVTLLYNRNWQKTVNQQ